jgi:hypothetical protein
MSVQVKSFITHKRGETDNDIQDSIDYDLARGRFALSDGVTNSFLPDVLSKMLTQAFVNDEDNASFPPDYLPQRFKEQRDQYMDALDEDARMLQEMVEEEFHIAAATFVGLTLKDNVFSWQVLGDSCLFILPEDGHLRCFCSMPVNISPEWKLKVDFGNRPRQIHSDGVVVGEWTNGKRTILKGWVVLASDALSDWLIKQHNLGNNPIDTLWNLNDNSDFENYVEQEYQTQRLKSDDESVIIIKIDEEAGSSANSESPVVSEPTNSSEPTESSKLPDSSNYDSVYFDYYDDFDYFDYSDYAI